MATKQLQGQQRLLQVPPSVVGMMSGTQYAFEDAAGNIGLHYTDGTEELRGRDGRTLRGDLPNRDFANYFAIVSFVQRARA